MVHKVLKSNPDERRIPKDHTLELVHSADEREAKDLESGFPKMRWSSAFANPEVLKLARRYMKASGGARQRLGRDLWRNSLTVVIIALMAGTGVAGAQSAPAVGRSGAHHHSSAAAAPIERLQSPPDVNVPRSRGYQFEQDEDLLSLPQVLKRQWEPGNELYSEQLISPEFIATRDDQSRSLTLKEAVFIALANNPAVKAAELGPVAGTESIRVAEAEFDPDTLAFLQEAKSKVPKTTPFETFSGLGLVTKTYTWNFTVNKILAASNGTLSLTFTNSRTITNNLTQTINPFYIPTLNVSLSQPLLRNFGWKFATLNVRMAESNQKQAQWTYRQQLEDFVLSVVQDYWNVVRAAENVEAAKTALKFYRDLERDNRIAVRVGTLAPLDLQEAQSARATAEANLATYQGQLEAAQAMLRQAVMLNPNGTFLPQKIEPADLPNTGPEELPDEKQALYAAMVSNPTLHAMRQQINTGLMQVKFQENQLLPQLNLGGQYGLNSMTGAQECGPNFNFTIAPPNCYTTLVPPNPSGQPNGYALPFRGGYGAALNTMFGMFYYNYIVSLSYELQLDNASARALLAQARVQYEQLRMRYRDVVSQVVVGIENALANLRADVKRVAATKAAVGYAKQALDNERQRFRVGMATTHDLLQFENELVNAQTNAVQAAIDLELARAQLAYAEGRLLDRFGIHFELQEPNPSRPWFTDF